MTASDSSRTAALPKRGKRAKPAEGVDAEVAVLQQMTVDELRRTYAAVMGEARNRIFGFRQACRTTSWGYNAVRDCSARSFRARQAESRRTISRR